MWLQENGLALAASLISLILAINTIAARRKDSKRTDKLDERQERQTAAETVLKVDEANTEKLAMTFNAMSKLNELLQKQNEQLAQDLSAFKRAYNLMVQRDRIRDQREQALIAVIKSELGIELPALPELPPLADI